MYSFARICTVNWTLTFKYYRLLQSGVLLGVFIEIFYVDMKTHSLVAYPTWILFNSFFSLPEHSWFDRPLVRYSSNGISEVRALGLGAFFISREWWTGCLMTFSNYICFDFNWHVYLLVLLLVVSEFRPSLALVIY